MEPIVQRSRSGEHLNVVREVLADQSMVSWRALITFATLDGILLLHSDDSTSAMHAFIARGGSIDWIVGIDAVTTVDALRLLSRIQNAHPGQVHVRAFESAQRTLFHPKLHIFQFHDRSGVVIVGSSNLTRGGLNDNDELSARALLNGNHLAAWIDAFVDFSVTPGAVEEITDELLERVAERQRREAAVVRPRAPRPQQREAEPQIAEGEVRVLV